MLKGIIFAHQELKKLVRFIKDIAAEIGKPKFEYQSSELDHDMYEDIKSFCLEKVEKALDTDDKDVRDANMAVVEKEVREQFPTAKFFTRFRKKSSEDGSLTTTEELTPEDLKRSDLFMPKSAFFPEFTVRVFSREVRRRFSPLRPSDPSPKNRSSTALTKKIPRDICTITICPVIPSATQSPAAARADVK